MMNKRLIVEMLNESYSIAKKRSYMYERANESEKTELFEYYLSAVGEFDSLTKMVLAFGYQVQRDYNDEIIGIKRVK